MAARFFCSDLAKLRLCSSIWISPHGTLTQQVCNDLQAFLSLRRKLGWSTNLLDATLSSLVRCTESSSEGVSAAWVEEIASIKRLSELCQQEIA
ncbi:hypothetical protein N7520_003204 [Penicillium odoratum]|uniref:uncharacterized protein n=1 Tax=Penicillium odoratum TaxID=1167516 RepID=UPI0025498CEB|nr:uncharacterized protein N7520_003204 [Penicillium odoratum]KAJ5772675.1 hypothetical protein N7520_003204 [Penicillium odoratum]